MIILKSQNFIAAQDVAKFVNINEIKREDIFCITMGSSVGDFTIFFYGDTEVKEVTKGVFGW